MNERVSWFAAGRGYLPHICATIGLAIAASTASAAVGAQLVSARDTSIALPAGGNGDSVPLAMSPDGRYVLFASWARDLTTHGNSLFSLDLFLRDRAASTTALVSQNLIGTGGGNLSSAAGAMSADGRYVVFESLASDLVAGDTNGVSDVFVRDMLAGTTQLVSAAPDGSPGNGASSDAVITPDGRYVAFISSASNLVAGDTNLIPDVFVRDLAAGTTRIVSVGAAPPTGPTFAAMAAPVITPDGRYVAFSSTAAGLASGTPANPTGEVYVRDLLGGLTVWASTNAAAITLTNLGLANPASRHPVLSDDGRFVAFKASASAGTGAAVILRYDAVIRATAVVDTNGIPSDITGMYDDVYGPEMTADGTYIAYARQEGGSSLYSSVRLWNGRDASLTLVSGDTNGAVPAKTAAYGPKLSSDASCVAFLSNATNLTANPLAGGFHIYWRQLQAGTQLVDVDTNGAGSSDHTGTAIQLSANGRLVVFCSPDGNLVGSDNNHADDVLLRDTTQGATELISRREGSLIPQSADRASILSPPSLSDDGRRAAFASLADDLVPGDTNSLPDVFVRDLLNGTNLLVSAAFDGGPAAGGASFGPVISGDGNWVVFISSATNLATGYTNACDNLFARDLSGGTTVPITWNTNALGGGDGDAFAPVVSQDGRYVAFLSKARNLVTGATTAGTNTYWRDRVAGVTVRLNNDGASAAAPSMSASGRYVAYSGAPSQIWIRDTQRGVNIYTNTGSVSSYALSPDGTRLLYRISDTIYVRDLAAGSNLVSISSKVPVQPAGQWSTNGRYFVFVTATSVSSLDTNGTNDVYLCDPTNGAPILVSVNSNFTAAANGSSDSPVVSGDGRFVAYRSSASDIVVGAGSPSPNIFLFDQLAGSNTLLGAAAPQTNGSSWISKPFIASAGSAVLFQSARPGVAPGDLNREPDVFASLMDRDGDGIPDAWTQQYFGHPTGLASDDSRAQDDADADGMSNLEEYLAGTDPTDPTSFFRLELTPQASLGGSVSLSWRAMPFRNYQLQAKDRLADPVWAPVPATVSIIGNRGSVTVSAPSPSRYYRIVTSY